MLRFTIQWARAICKGMNDQRNEKIKTELNKHKFKTDVDESLRFQEDFIIYDTTHEEEISGMN